VILLAPPPAADPLMGHCKQENFHGHLVVLFDMALRLGEVFLKSFL
jgi:hypothetical protein